MDPQVPKFSTTSNDVTVVHRNSTYYIRDYHRLSIGQ